MVVLDPGHVIGLAQVNQAPTAIVEWNGGMRTLYPFPDGGSPTSALAPVAVLAWTWSGGTLYWAELSPGGTTVIRRLVGSTASVIASDPAQMDYANSEFDLQVSGDRIYWASTGSAATGQNQTEIHSAPVAGGPISRRVLDGVYALTAWPWVTTTDNGTGTGRVHTGPIDLLNLQTGVRRTVAATDAQQLRCTPVWCRVTTAVAGGSLQTFAMQHPDGTASRRIGSGSLSPMDLDVALLDRFEVLGPATSGLHQLWLVDLSASRMVLLDESTVDTVAGRDNGLWWLTGQTWHILDLTQLR
jgi:hypothetical protein